MLKVKLPLLLCCTLFVISVQALHTIVEYIPNETPNNRYTLHTNGTVTDKWTGLIWQRCSLGQTWNAESNTCEGTPDRYKWHTTLSNAASNSFADNNDWRLPNIEELRSIVAHDRYGPSINIDVFHNTKSFLYWSSSPNNNLVDCDAWIIDFTHGTERYNACMYTWGAARLVRDAQ